MASRWAPEITLVASGARAGVMGGVPRIFIIALCLLFTVMFMATLWSLGSDWQDMGLQEAIAVDRAGRGQAVGRAAGASAGPRAPPICPKLMLPHGAALFRIPMDSIRKLRSGIFPIEVLGTSSGPLLHAWLPRLASLPDEHADESSVDTASKRMPRGQGLWLQLTTARTSRHPHARIGPLLLGASALVQPLQVVQILGPGGRRYGTFEPNEDSWRVVCEDQTVLAVTSSFPFPHLSALDAQGRVLASAGQQRWAGDGSDALIVQVNQGEDALLVLLCVLAVVLMSVDLAVPPMSFATSGRGRF